MPACQYKYESESPRIRFECNEPTRTNGKFCFFHDEDHYDEYEEDAAKRFEEKLLESISENKSLLCIGYYLPNVNFLLLLGEKSLPQRAYFTKVTFYKGASFAFATFSETADFTKATFSGAADFSEAAFSKATFIWTKFLETVVFFQAVFKERAFFSDVTFSDKAKFMSTRFQNNADFLNNEFKDEGHFHYTVFEHPNKVTFDNCSLSNVSFADSDITRIRFGDKVTWRGGKKGFGIMEEDSLRKRAKRKAPIRNEMITLELVLSIYRI